MFNQKEKEILESADIAEKFEIVKADLDQIKLILSTKIKM